MSFNYYDSLGARSYYCVNGDSSILYPAIANAISDKSTIDPAAVLGVLMKNYILSVRTLVQGVERSPWLAKPNEFGGWEQAALPSLKKIKLSPERISIEMKKRLLQEALLFIDGKKTLGILLSGGMDSRVVAGVIRQLQESGDFSGDVVALTWGLEDSRDVIYARRIAERFDWPFRHFPLDANVLKESILIAADRGAEYSPIHLHAMNAVSQVSGLDGVLAGSYGDSIGRGEYSGKKVCELPDILEKHLNQFAFMPHRAERDALITIKDDLAKERGRFSRRSEIEYREIEMQMHYMRRQLNACMEVIDDKIPLYQMFSSPCVYEFMWSLDPKCRTDDNYEDLLKKLPGNLLDIPWARTGQLYNRKKNKAQDLYSKQNNHYGLWLRNDLRNFILDEIQSGAIQSLGVFDEKALAMWARHWPKSKSTKADRLDEKMAWLGSLSLFVKKYNIQGIEQASSCTAFDSIKRLKGYWFAQIYRSAHKVLK